MDVSSIWFASRSALSRRKWSVDSDDHDVEDHAMAPAHQSDRYERHGR